MSSWLFIVALLLVWYLALVGYAIVTRPRRLPAASAGTRLRDEPPAVVDLLVTRCALSPAAPGATLLDLAARRLVELRQPSLDAEVLVRVGPVAPTGLLPYEQRVHARVARVAGDQFTPLRLLQSDAADGGPDWFRRFRAEVIEDAAQRGLVRSRQTPVVLMVAASWLAIAAGCIGATRTTSASTPDWLSYLVLAGWGAGAGLATGALSAAAFVHVRGARHTTAGRQVGCEWLGVARWLAGHRAVTAASPAAVVTQGRILAYAVALGLNPSASAALGLQTGHVRHLRSRYGGTPHTVTVRFPRSPMAYTQAGARLTWSLGVLACWAWCWSSAWQHLPQWPLSARVAFVAAGTLLPARAAYRTLRALMARLRPVEVTGQLLASHPYRPQPGAPRSWHELVIDDLRPGTARPWLVRSDRLGDVQPGDVVRLRAQPWTRYGLSIARITP